MKEKKKDKFSFANGLLRQHYSIYPIAEKIQLIFPQVYVGNLDQKAYSCQVMVRKILYFIHPPISLTQASLFRLQ